MVYQNYVLYLLLRDSWNTMNFVVIDHKIHVANVEFRTGFWLTVVNYHKMRGVPGKEPIS